MYSLKELTDNVVNGLDELFNVNIKHFCVTYSENGCLMKLVTNLNKISKASSIIASAASLEISNSTLVTVTPY